MLNLKNNWSGSSISKIPDPDLKNYHEIIKNLEYWFQILNNLTFFVWASPNTNAPCWFLSKFDWEGTRKLSLFLVWWMRNSLKHHCFYSRAFLVCLNAIIWRLQFRKSLYFNFWYDYFYCYFTYIVSSQVYQWSVLKVFIVIEIKWDLIDILK